MEPQEKTLEETLCEVEGIIDRMQQQEISLEDSFVLYQQGIEKLKQCHEKIDAVEKKMLLLNQENISVEE